MFRILLLLLIGLFVGSTSMQARPVVTFSTKTIYASDTLGWLYYPGDDSSMALSGYDDRNWKVVKPELNLDDTYIAQSFKGICWFRLHFRVDSSLNNQPLAIILNHDGASEIFIDGELVWNFGEINGPEKSAYQAPQYFPAVIPAFDTLGEHVLAIRYANYGAPYKLQRYGRTRAGMSIRLADAGSAVANYASNKIPVTAAGTLLCGLFAALGFLHLILFLYQRHDRSNLYFSTFCLGISGCALFPTLLTVVPAPDFNNNCRLAFVACLAISAVSLNGFTSFLFTTNKWRFRVTIFVGIANMIILCFSMKVAIGCLIGLIVYSAVEAFRLMIVGIIRKIEGSRIIAGGLSLFLMILLLVIFSSIAFKGKGLALTGNPALIWMTTAVISILCIPISFSIFLAKRFAGINKNLSTQLERVQILSAKTIEQEAEKQRILENKQTELEAEVKTRTAEVVQQKDEIEQQHNELKDAKKKSDDLLLNILPAEIAEELKETGHSDARLYNDVTVLFTDFVDFTIFSEQLSPAALVAEIDHCFKAFDRIIGQFGLEKIKTIGDAYLAVCGLPNKNDNHATAALNAALAIRDFMHARKQEHNNTFEIRLGIHSGPVIAGIVGLKKFAYDIWGDTVNTAARMEQSGEAGKINISGATFELVKDQFKVTYRGELQAKNKGKMGMYFVDRLIG